MRLEQEIEKQAGERQHVNGSPQKRLAGKVAVVTGSSRGIGKAMTPLHEAASGNELAEEQSGLALHEATQQLR